MKTFFTLFKTEAKLAIRDGNMVFFGIAFPVGVMLLLGFLSSPENTLLSFAGVSAIGMCAAGLMGIPITFSSYRHGKILKRFRVTPVSPAMLLGAVSALQTAFAIISAGAVFLIARLIFGITITGSPMRLILTYLLVHVSIFSIGYLIASLASDTQKANLACTLLYFPMLFLSGATIPYEILPKGLRAFADFFPLSQGIALIKGAVTGSSIEADTGKIIALSLLSVVSYGVSIKFFRWE